MMRWLCALLLILYAQTVLAETIRIRSGDHADFTRLVLTILPGRDWQFGRSGESYVLFSGDPVDIFETARVFDRIPSGRIADLVSGQSPGRLQIVTGCDCHATAYLWRPDRLVIDVVEGPAPADSPFETQLDPVAETIRTAPQTPLPLVFTDRNAPDQSELTLPFLTSDLPVEIFAAENALILQTETAIYDSLARAASQGLLDIVDIEPAGLPVAAERIDQPIDPEIAPAFVPGPIAEITSPTRPGLTARTSFERDFSSIDPALLSGSVGETCLDDRHFDLAGWADSRPFSEQIGEANSLLTAEFDVYSEGAVEKLARIYLHFGFGREAIQTLSLDDERTHEREIMITLAHLLDGEPIGSRVFEGQLGCVRAVALWSGLARESLEGMDESERNAAIMAFRTLPEAVRGHIGASLAQLLLDVGDPVAADSILGAAALYREGPSVAADLTAAEIELESEGADFAIAALQDLIENEPRLTPEGLVRLIDLTLREGRAVDPSVISLAEAMQSEYRGTPEAANLANSIVRALVASDQFDDARILIATDLPPMSTEMLSQLRSDTIIAMASRMPDSSFIEMAFDDVPVGIEPTAVNALARRLIDLGFAERATALLYGPASGTDMSERRYLRAEAALQLGAYDQVAEVLTGLQDPRAKRLRALSLAAQGDFAAALLIESEASDIATDPTLAWRAGAWQALDASPDPLLQAASEAMLTDQNALREQQPLAERRDLLKEAGQTRELAAQLLDRFALDPVDPAGTEVSANSLADD